MIVMSIVFVCLMGFGFMLIFDFCLVKSLVFFVYYFNMCVFFVGV